MPGGSLPLVVLPMPMRPTMRPASSRTAVTGTCAVCRAPARWNCTVIVVPAAAETTRATSAKSLIAVAPIGANQAGTVIALNDALTAAARGRALVSPQNLVQLNERPLPQPDCAV